MADVANRPVPKCGKDHRGLNRMTHGHARGKRVSPEWSAWKGMRQRCHSTTHKRYPLYGGRGIRVCQQWRDSFEAFFADMGRKPSERHSLDRIDVNGDYEPGNCRWADQQEQCRNQRRNRVVNFEGQAMTLAEMCERTGMEPSHIRYHLDRGKTPDEAVAFILAKRSRK